MFVCKSFHSLSNNSLINIAIFSLLISRNILKVLSTYQNTVKPRLGNAYRKNIIKYCICKTLTNSEIVAT